VEKIASAESDSMKKVLDRERLINPPLGYYAVPVIIHKEYWD
jgi:hypothetical protein